MKKLKQLTSRVDKAWLKHFGKYYDNKDTAKIVSFMIIYKDILDKEMLQIFYIMLSGMYKSQKVNREEYFDTDFSENQLAELNAWEQNLWLHLMAIKNDYIRKFNVLLYYTNDTMYDIIKVEIGRVLYSQKGTTIRGMGGRLNQVYTTQYTHGRSIVLNQCFEELKLQGGDVRKQWVYTYESKVARTSHVHADGLESNEDGNFIIDGQVTKAPTMFGDPKQDYNCKCTMKLVHEPIKIGNLDGV